MSKTVRPLPMTEAAQESHQGARLGWPGVLVVLGAVLLAANLIPAAVKFVAFGGDGVLLDYFIRVGEALGMAG